MNGEEALEFLKRNQPLPADTVLTEETIKTYDQVRKWFMENPEPGCIPLFLNSFGEGDGFGVYQLVEDVLKQFETVEVVAHLKVALRSRHRSVQYWCAQISANFPSAELVDSLEPLLRHDDYDLKYAAVTSLEQIGGDKVIEVLNGHLGSESDFEIRELIDEVLSELSRP